MAFVGVQFAADDTIAVVNRNWLTPRKKEVWWPPFKFQAEFDKAAKSDELPVPAEWKIYKIQRCYFECDDYSKAQNKIKNLQYTSDIQTTDEGEGEEIIKKKRERAKPQRFKDYSEDEEEDSTTNKRNFIKRPKLDSLKSKVSHLNVCQTSPKTSNNPSTSFYTSPSTHGDFNGGDFNGSDLGSSISNSERLDKEFQEKLVRVMLQIKEQNTSILKSLEKLTKEKNRATLKFNLPEDTPVTFPINSNADIDIFEEFLNDKENLYAVAVYLSTIGGRELTNITNNILKFLVTDNIAKQYSFYGKRNNRKTFSSLNLNKAVLGGAKTASPDSSEKEIESIIKVWLKHVTK